VSGTSIIRILGAACMGALLGVSGWVTFRTWARQIPLRTEPFSSVQFDRGNMVVPLGTEILHYGVLCSFLRKYVTHPITHMTPPAMNISVPPYPPPDASE
jgi:hypothetical protein